MQENLQREQGITVQQIIKSGSLAKGTAIPGDFDLDIVLYSTSIDPDSVNEHGVGDVLDKLQLFLEKHFGTECKELEQTNHAVSFLFHGQLKVDLLLSPYWKTKTEFHSFLKLLPEYERRNFSCSAAKWERYFFRKQPSQVKQYIKRAKNWRNEVWPKKQNGDGRPKSILIGVLIIEAYKKCGGTRHNNPGHVKVEEELKELVQSHESLQIRPVRSSEHCFTPPYILDPANPYNNLYISGIGNYKTTEPEAAYKYGPGNGNWTAFVERIHTVDLSQAI